MRKLAFLLLLAAASPSAPAQTRVTISQFEQLLAGLHGQSDGKVAHQLSSLELTERITSATLARWERDFAGKRTQETLTDLADRSAFLNLPAADLPRDPPPEIVSQQKIFSQTIAYVSEMLPKLPDFSALRTTTCFEVATPHQVLQQQGFQISQLNTSRPSYRLLGPANSADAKGAQLYFAGIWGIVVTYRDGLEVAETSSKGERHARPPAGELITRGEFGPIFYVVLKDVMRGKVTWSHWEQNGNGTLAVFRYDVPKQASHFAIESGVGNAVELPAYHGEIGVDAASGTIFRITVEEDQPAPDSIAEASILVEYGPVSIGGSNYICPVRAVALSRQPASSSKGNLKADPPPIFVNDVSFTQYHVFRAEARILPGNDASP
jgi:hypothetical protein